MGKIAQLLILATMFLVAGLVNFSDAYVLDSNGNGSNLFWNQRTVKYRIASGNVPGGQSGEAAVRNAFNTWSSVSDNLNYAFDGYTGNPTQAYDQRNIVYWAHQGWAWDPNLLALTFRYYDVEDGRLLDADIVFNATRYNWAVGGGTYDIENSASHEVGHFSGLGHSGDSDATMYGSTRAGELKKRDLSSDDIAGLIALYGGTASRSSSTNNVGVVSDSASGVSSGGGGGGGCSIGVKGSEGSAMDLVWIALLIGGILFRRFRQTDCEISSL